jgi:hypothetical protein
VRDDWMVRGMTGTTSDHREEVGRRGARRHVDVGDGDLLVEGWSGSRSRSAVSVVVGDGEDERDAVAIGLDLAVPPADAAALLGGDLLCLGLVVFAF